MLVGLPSTQDVIQRSQVGYLGYSWDRRAECASKFVCNTLAFLGILALPLYLLPSRSCSCNGDTRSAMPWKIQLR